MPYEEKFHQLKSNLKFSLARDDWSGGLEADGDPGDGGGDGGGEDDGGATEGGRSSCPY